MSVQMGLVTWMIAAVLLIIAILSISKYVVEFIELRRKLYRLPQSKGNIIFGNVLDTLVPPNKLLKVAVRLIADNPPLCVFWFLSYPFMQIHQPKHLEVILGNVQHIEKSLAYTFLHDWLGTGLLTSKGKKWHSHRKMLTPAFHFAILENFVQVFAKKSEILVKKLKKNVGPQSFDIYPYITACALDIICETAMGVEINAQDQEKLSDYVEAVYKITLEVTMRILSPWLYPDFVFNLFPSGRRFKKYVNVLHSFTEKVIQQRKKQYASSKASYVSSEDLDLGKKKRMTFLDLLLEAAQNGQNLTDEEIREEVDTFMFEGHDTTTAAISWTLYLLATHPDIQEKVYEELENIFENSDRSPSMKDLSEMKYLERVIKETLRLYPSVPFIVRKLREDVEVDGYILPRSIEVSMVPYYTHRLPEYFPEPDKFNPDNFLPERVAARHPYAYIPFSAGPRNCIGQKFAILEEKTVLSYILRNYRVHATEHVPEPIPELIFRPGNGIKLKITPRKSSS